MDELSKEAVSLVSCDKMVGGIGCSGSAKGFVRGKGIGAGEAFPIEGGVGRSIPELFG